MPCPVQLECRAVLLAETPLAIQVQRMPHAPGACRGGPEQYWVPRSQIGYLRKTINNEANRTDIVFTCPEWLIEKGGFWELVP